MVGGHPRDEGVGQAGQHVGEVVVLALLVRAAVVDDLLVFFEGVVELRVAPVGHVPVVPARRGRGRHVVAVEVLAHHCRAIAGGVQVGGHGRVLVAVRVEGLVAPVGPGVVIDARVVRETPREDRGPRRAAERVGHVVISERRTVTFKGSEVGHELGRHQVGGEVVGEDEHEVGMDREGSCRRLHRGQHNKERQKYHDYQAVPCTALHHDLHRCDLTKGE